MDTSLLDTNSHLEALSDLTTATMTQGFMPSWNLRKIEAKWWGNQIYEVLSIEKVVYRVERFRKIYKCEIDIAVLPLALLLLQLDSKCHIVSVFSCAKTRLRFGHNDVANACKKVVQQIVSNNLPCSWQERNSAAVATYRSVTFLCRWANYSHLSNVEGKGQRSIPL